MDPRPLLAFDTSTEVLAVAAAGPRGNVTWNGAGGAAASAQLVPRIHAVLAEAGVALRDLQAIAFGRGPGAFTGLRTSCAVAQGLGFGLGRPLLPVDSLLVVAEDARGALAMTEPGRIAVAMDARMDEIYGAIYEWSGERTGGAGDAPADTPLNAPARWCTLRQPALLTLAQWNGVLEHEAGALHGLAGSALPAFGERLHRPGALAVHAQEVDRAAALLRLAREALAAGEGIDAAQALPLYLRDKVALTTDERLAARVAKAAGASA
ncbi:MAG: tRNA (adenosine(37)-N6)-threonylcarbamoyltransferase complex dimerization subunit type 1 TsaB [Rubrivivax sp.]|nr:tRNA (adenosine(37)-N6)-threonylcarbamoyltransferase complex dimerization subunit type 1 TsaB [Rubrivivax sp.]